MNTKRRRSQRDYSLAFKLAVVDQVEKGEMTYSQAQERYGIQGSSTVLTWLRKHGQQDWSLMALLFARKGAAMAKPDLPLTPEQRIKELEQQLDEANQKAQFFESVVDVLQKDYGCRVNKKAVRQVLAQKQIQGLNVTRACRYLGFSRQAYYQHFKADAARQAHNLLVLDFVREERLHQPRLGTRKLHSLLKPKALHIGRDRLFDLLRAHRQLVPRKRAYHKTTHSHHHFRCHPNLLKGPEQIVPDAPEQLWVADITYLPTRQGSAYLSLITDAFSRKIVGHHVHDTLHTAAVIQAMQKALKGRQYSGGLVHHSDRGVHYCSAPYQQLHAKYGIRCSMTDGYDCYQNALAERVNGILKTEFLLVLPKNLAEAQKMVDQSVQTYNTRRPHLALKYKTPDAVHRAFR
ncbi:IS3 family transposase [Marinobacter koreensis]|uniref:IS3 family transposase n=1 Tax=Marinobacter koreensis TaxID=335974 RepID=A0ABW0RS65_9GAMM|nr:IS3 family transposase [Marinobacter koreensis]MCK7547976.1 IS3 family transposase [Marinobacter koreensis]